MKHHPYLFFAGRYGAWCHCGCGKWHSRTYTTISGAHLAFGEHLLAEAAEMPFAYTPDDQLGEPIVLPAEQFDAPTEDEVIWLDEDGPDEMPTSGMTWEEYKQS